MTVFPLGQSRRIEDYSSSVGHESAIEDLAILIHMFLFPSKAYRSTEPQYYIARIKTATLLSTKTQAIYLLLAI